MLYGQYRWRNREIRHQVEVLDGKRSPTLLLKNATYLNGIMKTWMQGNIWIYHDRIVYVGDRLPGYMDESCEIIDCSEFFLVPGYIEPHAHPAQVYNPLSFAQYAAQSGTTTLINDNLQLAFFMEKREAFTFITDLHRIPVNMYWWCRLDSQTFLPGEESKFTNQTFREWIEQETVVQAGELTSWPRLLDGDDLLLHWLQETKRKNKKVEGHFPGASEKTLAKLKLFGADGDHEAINGEEVMRRLLQGYMVSLRHSSIRPDLPGILQDLIERGLNSYDYLMFTTDGSTPSFYEQGVIAPLIKIAMNHGVPEIDAYLMATLNPAKYFQLDHIHGLIGTGRVADINFLTDVKNPEPFSVLAKGRWVKRNGQPLDFYDAQTIPWDRYGFHPLIIDWELTTDDLSVSIPFGIELENTVITKPYSPVLDMSLETIPEEYAECFFILIDRRGKWRVSSIIKGFAKDLGGMATSFTASGDLLLIGKNKEDIIIAFQRLKELHGGIVIVEEGKILFELALPLLGQMSTLPLQQLIPFEKRFVQLLKKKGYPFHDPLYTLMFFTSIHLPYIRVTPAGVYEVKKKRVLFPSVMR